jgi:flagellar assembly protein FliH
MAQVPASLASALAALSDRVRIVPVAGDEPGTCIIEMPDEIVDASAETQLNNIRGIVMNAPSMGTAVNVI